MALLYSVSVQRIWVALFFYYINPSRMKINKIRKGESDTMSNKIIAQVLGSSKELISHNILLNINISSIKGFS